MRQFNLRNPEVVPQLKDLEGCNVVLGNFFSVDSQNGGHSAAAAIINAIRDDVNDTLNPPCAIVGPSLDVPVSEVSTVAQSLQIPLVAYGSVDLRLVNPYFYPYTSRPTPDSQSIAKALVDYTITVHERNNCIVILYPLTDVGLQLREAMATILEVEGIIWDSIGYTSYPRVSCERRDSARSA